jgi:AcrR family transcriptional regulator
MPAGYEQSLAFRDSHFREAPRVRAAVRTAPRKRPKQERARETVEAILTATARILVHEGFEGASTNRIADEAGVSVGSLYQYFPNKESLVAALVERHVAEMLAVVEAALPRWRTAPLRRVVREMVETMLAAHAVDPKLHRVLVEQVPRIGSLEQIADVERRFESLARAGLEARRRELRPKRLDLAAFVVVRTVEALTHAAVLDRPETLGDAALVDEVTELLARYLEGERRSGTPAARSEKEHEAPARSRSARARRTP